MQWCELPQVESIHVGSMFQESFSHLTVAIGTGVVQWNKTPVEERCEQGGEEEGRRGGRVMRERGEGGRKEEMEERWRKGGRDSPFVFSVYVSSLLQ